MHFKQTLITLASDTLWQASDASNSEIASTTPAPTVDGMDPSIGNMAGSTITIQGSNLQNATQVVVIADGLSGGPQVDSAYGTIVPGSDGPFSLEVTLPADNSAFLVLASVEVVTPSGMASIKYFTYEPPPSIASVSPQIGPGGGNEIVEIQGNGLEGVTAVNFGNYPAVVDSDPQYAGLDSEYVLYVISPEGSGTVDVNVTTAGGTTLNVGGQSPDPTAFTFVPPPNIDYMSTAVGALAGNQTVTLTGTNLENYTAVYFGSVEVPFFLYYGHFPVSNISVNQAGTQMTISEDPAQTSPGPVNVTVTTPGGTSNPNGTYFVQVGAIDLPEPDQAQFTYFAVPAVASLSPAAGPLNSVGPIFGGQIVTNIVGTDLGPAADASVSFGQNAGTIVSDVQLLPSLEPRLWEITADVPAVAASTVDVTVDVTVTTPGGASAISRPADAYTYVPPPTVSDVTGLDGLQASGPLSGNTQFEISGTNLAGRRGGRFHAGHDGSRRQRCFRCRQFCHRELHCFRHQSQFDRHWVVQCFGVDDGRMVGHFDGPHRPVHLRAPAEPFGNDANDWPLRRRQHRDHHRFQSGQRFPGRHDGRFWTGQPGHGRLGQYLRFTRRDGARGANGPRRPPKLGNRLCALCLTAPRRSGSTTTKSSRRSLPASRLRPARRPIRPR